MIKPVKRILQILFSVVLALSLWVLLKNLIIEPYFSNLTADEVREIYHQSDSAYSMTDSATNEDKFSELLRINPDICGWIYIPNTKIDYPVLQASKEDPNFYLSHNYKKEHSKYGSIFADFGSMVKSSPKNTVLFGHHMADGQMFADLMKFSDLDFYRQNPLIEYDTIVEKGKWKIISVFKTNTLAEHGKVFQYVVSRFASEDNFMDYVNDVKKRSLIETGIDVNKKDRLLTLSTCSYEFDGFRTVIVARKVRSGESEQIDISHAHKAGNPLMPDCWYKKYGGSMPS